MIRAFVDSLAVTAESTAENQAALAAGRQLSREATINLAMEYPRLACVSLTSH